MSAFRVTALALAAAFIAMPVVAEPEAAPSTLPPQTVAQTPPLPKSLPLTDTDVASWANVPVVLDRCIADVGLRGDFSKCKALSQYLTEVSARIGAIANPPPPAPAPDRKP